MTTKTGKSCFVLQCIKQMYQLLQWANPLWFKHTSYTSKALQPAIAERLVWNTTWAKTPLSQMHHTPNIITQHAHVMHMCMGVLDRW